MLKSATKSVTLHKVKGQRKESAAKDTAKMTSFKDVKDALEEFTGETTKSVDDWIEYYENVAKMCGWNETQMYFFARTLLKGAAKGAVESDETVINYKTLVEALKTEFKRTIYDIHRDLIQRKKLASESYLEYFYKMIKIGRKMDERSMVQYIVNGLPGEKSEKFDLYFANNLDELKVKLKVYSRCKNCGSKSHQEKSCPDRQKGKRCFKCNNVGHVSRNCRSE